MELYRSKIRELLEFNNQREYFYKEKEEAIQEVEERLNVKLPASYRWFLKEYGGGGNGLYVNDCNDIL
ncbi:TPA: SMI1/KNR4 family protein, partial [Bacillus cereus]